MRYQFYTADVFTDHIFGGNPLAVFPKASGLSTEQMQRVAQELNLSETVFVTEANPETNTYTLRIFTPAAEVPFAGHPTVGTAYILAALNIIGASEGKTNVVFQEGVGPIPVSIDVVDGQPVSAQLSAAVMPEFGPEPPSINDLAAMISLQPEDILTGKFSPQAVSCGVPFLFIPVKNRDALKRAQLNTELWQKHLENYWSPHPYTFTFEHELEGSSLRARMFAPAFGIPEDPATGAAATALAGYLGVRDAQTEGTLRWVVEQGFEMGRPSLLEVEADKSGGEIVAIRVGGSSVLVSEGTMEIPD